MLRRGMVVNRRLPFLPLRRCVLKGGGNLEGGEEREEWGKGEGSPFHPKLTLIAGELRQCHDTTQLSQPSPTSFVL